MTRNKSNTKSQKKNPPFFHPSNPRRSSSPVPARHSPAPMRRSHPGQGAPRAPRDATAPTPARAGRRRSTDSGGPGWSARCLATDRFYMVLSIGMFLSISSCQRFFLEHSDMNWDVSIDFMPATIPSYPKNSTSMEMFVGKSWIIDSG